ncbi:Probable receptor-like protein kinase At5g18500 [Linum perenne]
MSRKTGIFGLQVWEVICICVAIFVIVILSFSIYLSSRKKKSSNRRSQHQQQQIPAVSKEIKEVFQIEQVSTDEFAPRDGGVLLTIHDKSNENDSDKVLVHVGMAKKNKNGNGNALGWGHWFTLRDLELATNRFSKDNVLGEGGYGVVYRGNLVNGSPVAVKKILNNLGQAEKEFRVEVEAIGHVRHKNLVRLLGYCIEGTHRFRMLVYEYVNNGNLEQWLHGAMRHHGYLTWEARIKVLLGTAKALAYLHDAIEPKVVHRDIKSSNILIDDDFNAKVSDFGLAKLLGAGKSHVTTRVMGTFGYVAPEYANSGLLNEKSDVYSFGVVLLEAITGRDPVDYGRSSQEVNLVDWLKMMVGSRRSEEVVDPNIERRPSTRSLKRALLTALRCVDPDSEKRPKMGQVVRMLESEEYPIPREDRRQRRAQGGNSIETESQKENSDSDCPLAAAGDSTRRS